MKIFEKELFNELDVLQFSADPAVKPEWFQNYEYSVYDGHNTLDLQNIDRDDDAYDLVICNHVLEHVPSDGDALRELGRVTKDGGIVFLTVPDPARRGTTVDWGYPDETRHGHFREYGADIVNRFEKHIPNMFAFKAPLLDDATGTPDIAFVFAHKNNKILRRISESGIELRF